MEFITRDYNSIVLNGGKGTITKTSSEIRLQNESNYYLQIPSKVANYFPRYISYSEETEYSLELEYLPFENLGNLWLNSKLDDTLWSNVCKYLEQAISVFGDIPYRHENPSLLREKMFVDKTEKEYRSLVTNFSFFSKLDSFDHVIVNSKKFKNFKTLWKQFLKQYVLEECCGDNCLSFMHGDLCFSNILCGYDEAKNVVLKFIDPRGSFGEEGCLGDVYYDLAKLMHSVDGKYECFIYDKFDLSTDTPDSFSLSFNTELKEISPLFSKYLYANHDETKIKVIQGLIFIGMCARHYDSHERQVAMYLTGLRILNECEELINA